MCVCVCVCLYRHFVHRLLHDFISTLVKLGVRLNLSLDSNWGSTEWDDDKSVWMIV